MNFTPEEMETLKSGHGAANLLDCTKDRGESSTCDTPRTPLGANEVTAHFIPILLQMLDDAEKQKFENIIGWEQDGLSFKVRKNRDFENKILPRYLNQTRVRSFQRQLIVHGFTRVQGGPARGTYYHPLFTRDNRDMCLQIKRVSSSKQTLAVASVREAMPLPRTINKALSPMSNHFMTAAFESRPLPIKRKETESTGDEEQGKISPTPPTTSPKQEFRVKESFHSSPAKNAAPLSAPDRSPRLGCQPPPRDDGPKQPGSHFVDEYLFMLQTSFEGKMIDHGRTHESKELSYPSMPLTSFQQAQKKPKTHELDSSGSSIPYKDPSSSITKGVQMLQLPLQDEQLRYTSFDVSNQPTLHNNSVVPFLPQTSDSSSAVAGAGPCTPAPLSASSLQLEGSSLVNDDLGSLLTEPLCDSPGLRLTHPVSRLQNKKEWANINQLDPPDL